MKYVYYPPGHPLSAKSILTLEDFRDLPYINLSTTDNYRHRLDRHFQQAGRMKRQEVLETPIARCLGLCHGVCCGILDFRLLIR